MKIAWFFLMHDKEELLFSRLRFGQSGSIPYVRYVTVLLIFLVNVHKLKPKNSQLY